MTGSLQHSTSLSSPLDLDGREMPFGAWKQMGRRPGFKYEYDDGRARISVQKGAAPFVLARLEDLVETTATIELPRGVALKPVPEVPLSQLIEAWIEGFRDSPDYHGFDESALRKSATQQVQNFVGSDETSTRPEAHDASRVAVDGHGVAGALFLSRAKARPWLAAIFVRPDRRRQGVASCLLREAALRLRALGEELLVSSYLVANQESARWHAALGFVEIPDWLTCCHRYAILHHNWRTGHVKDCFAAQRQLRELADTVRSLQSEQLGASGKGTPHDWLEEQGERFDAFAERHLPQRPVTAPKQLTL